MVLQRQLRQTPNPFSILTDPDKMDYPKTKTCNELRELGFPQDTEKAWVQTGWISGYGCDGCEEWEIVPNPGENAENFRCAAPSAKEIASQLGVIIDRSAQAMAMMWIATKCQQEYTDWLIAKYG
jgi:hypothetical protein